MEVGTLEKYTLLRQSKPLLLITDQTLKISDSKRDPNNQSLDRCIRGSETSRVGNVSLCDTFVERAAQDLSHLRFLKCTSRKPTIS
jgi:hypothetical protein